MTTSTQNNTSSSDAGCRCNRDCGCCSRKTQAAEKVSEGFFRKRPWLLVVLAFALLFSAWTAFFIIAYRNPTQQIPVTQVR